MIIGVRNFAGGKTLKNRVSGEEAQVLHEMAGYDGSTGEAVPDRVPTRVSATALGGSVPWQVPFAYVDEDGTRIICRDANEKVRVMGVDGSWSAPGDTIRVIPDNAPFRVGKLVVFAEDGANPRMTAFEPDAGGVLAIAATPTSGGNGYLKNDILTIAGGTATVNVDSVGPIGEVRTVSLRKRGSGYTVGSGKATTGGNGTGCTVEITAVGGVTRPFSFKGPRDYVDSARLTVTPSPHPATGVALFGLVAAETDNPDSHFEIAPGVVGKVLHDPHDAWETLQFLHTCPASTKCAIYDLGATGVDLTGMVYLVLDLKLYYSGTDPREKITAPGVFINSHQQVMPSGFDFVLYSDQACTEVIKNFAIPQLDTSGVVNRVVIHLGELSATTVKGLSINTAGYFVAPDTNCSYNLVLHAGAFTEDWKFNGNTLLPRVVFGDSPWCDDLPPSPGTESTCATVLETFPDVHTSHTPDRPLLRFRYCFRGRDQVSTDYYRVMISNPSLASTPDVLADPWRYYTLSWTIPEDEDGRTVMDDYGDYATHALLYRSVYRGIESSTEIGEVGVWGDYEFIGAAELASTLSYNHVSRVDEPCTMAQATNLVTCADHGLEVGNAITFGTATGGVTADREYYVISVPSDDTFTFSEEPGGETFDITGDGSNTFSSVAPAYEVDGEPIPRVLEENHDYADSARYGIVADQRVYLLCQTYDSDVGVWRRPLAMQASNAGEYGSFPSTPGDENEATDGSDLGDYSPDSAMARGLLVKDDAKFVFTNKGFWELVGDNAETGWRFLRRDSIGLVDNTLVVDCRSEIDWADNGLFYAYAGGRAVPVSKGIIDSSLIDWSYPHGACFSRERYIVFCYLADPDQETGWCLLIRDLETGAWRAKHSLAYKLAGICAADAGGDVYGLTQAGDVVNLFGGMDEYGADEPTFVLATAYLLGAPPGHERHARHLVLEAITDEDGIEVEIDVWSQGRYNDRDTGRTLTLTRTKTKYGAGDFNVNLVGDAFKVQLTYRGQSPPTVTFLGLALDDELLEAA